MKPVEIADCVGLWQRTLLIEADGTRDTGEGVRWLQGTTAFVDTRGFGGWLRQRDDVFVWDHLAETQPDPPDAGRMHWDGETLVETGVHASYTEHWQRDCSDVSTCWSLRLSDSGGHEALLLRVGDLFGWLRHGPQTHVYLGGSGEAFRASLDGKDLIVDEDGSGISRRWRVEHVEGSVKI